MAKATPYIPVFIAYTEEDGQLVSPEYDDPAVREEVGSWMRGLGYDWEWIAVGHANLQSEVERVARLSRHRPTVVLNLCDGDDVNGYPGLSVVRALEAAGIPFTGARSRFYEVSTSKSATKQRLYEAGVRTAPWVVLRDGAAALDRAGKTLGWPIFIKPDVAAGSSGITPASRAGNLAEAHQAVEEAFAHMDGYPSWVGGLIAEPYLAGREFTVLVVGDATRPDAMDVYVPVERVFGDSRPVADRFLTCDRVLEEGGDDEAYAYAPAPDELRDALVDLARQAMIAIEGTGYARIDIRYDVDDGAPYVLEVNANCGITGDPSSAVGSILQHSDVSIDAFICRIIADRMMHS